MTLSACGLMRKAVVSSVALIAAGSLLVLLALLLPLQSVVPVILTSLGFMAIFAGVAVMLVTVIAVMLPMVSSRLELCQH
jgi:hypothetical protein